MNRLLQASKAISDLLPESSFGDIDISAESPAKRAPHKCFVPLHYERNYAYPLLVWLHHGEGSERQLSQVMPHISLRNYVAVAPRGTASRVDENGDETIHCWDQTADGIMSARRAVLDCVHGAQEQCHINSNRIFIAGYADGGTMAMRMAFTCPEIFAGVISLHGPLPRGHLPLGKWDSARGSSVLLVSGRQSETYPEDEVCKDLRLLHAAGFSVVARQYDTDDDVSSSMLGDVDRWLMSIVTQSTSESRRSRSGTGIAFN